MVSLQIWQKKYNKSIQKYFKNASIYTRHFSKTVKKVFRIDNNTLKYKNAKKSHVYYNCQNLKNTFLLQLAPSLTSR